MIDDATATRLIDALGLHLTAEQRRIVFWPGSGPAVVIAGAGSGKTAVMAARMAALVVSGHVPADAILGLTFTRRAAGELAERVDRYLAAARRAGLIAEVGPGAEIATYHSFAQRFVREYGIFAGVDPDLRIETDFGLLPLAFETAVRSSALSGHTEVPLSVAGAVELMRRLDGELAEHVVSTAALRTADTARLEQMAAARPTSKVSKVLASARLRIAVSHLVDDYRRAKEDAGVMDYADMMRLAHRTATGDAEVVQRVRQTHRAVLLDEYQDTSVVQRALLVHLFGDGHQVMAVGDPKQAIYGFRGAAVGNITAFPEHFRDADGRLAEVFTLSANFRSAAPIVAVANETAATRQSGLSAGTGATLSAGAGATLSAGAGATLTVGRPELPGEVTAHFFASSTDERRFLVDTVRQTIRSGRLPAADIMVLARGNDDVAAITADLLAAGVPAVSSDDGALFDSGEVRDVLAYLAVIADPAANAELLRILVGPRWRIGLRDLNLLGARARQLAGQPWTPPDVDDLSARLVAAAGAGADPVEVPCLADALADPGDAEYSPAARSRFAALAAELSELTRLAGSPVPEVINQVVRVTGLDTEILVADDAERRLAAVDSLLTVAGQFHQSSATGHLAAFLRAVRLAAQADADPGFDPPMPAGCVRVMTVHKAKGLEAEMVLLPGFTDATYDRIRLTSHWTTSAAHLPDDVRDDRGGSGHGPAVALTEKDVAQLQEPERSEQAREAERLVYVALTRARSELIVTGHCWHPDRTQPRQPSRHLAALAQSATVGVGQWYEPPPTGTVNPFAAPPNADADGQPFAANDPAAARRRELAATLQHAASGPDDPSEFDPADAEQVARWDADIEALIAERREIREATTTVELPTSLSVTGVQQLLADPHEFAASLRRPMPRRPSRQARRGTRFHDWLAARHSQRALIDPMDLAEWASDRDVDALSEIELAELVDAFEAGQYANRRPAFVEYPFAVTIDGIPVSGRIDAVFREEPVEPGGEVRWEVVDWKTSGRAVADEVQLAVYRLAWASIMAVPVERVDAAFYFVPIDTRVPAGELPTPAELGARIRAATSPRAGDRRTNPR